jgi:hypothetical protein
MSQVRPKILLRYGRQNQPVRVPTQDMLIDPPAQTFLTTDALTATASIEVGNILNFAINQILLIGELGNQNTEIIKTHGSTAPSGSSITLANNLRFTHTAGTPVTVMSYDQVEISNAATVAGAKTVLGSVITIAGNQLNTEYNDVAASAGYYFARWKNSITSSFSAYSDPSPITAYTIYSARSIIDGALGLINQTQSEVFSDEFAFQMIDMCQMEVLREFKRWSFMQAFDTIIGETSTGQWKIALPDDCDDQNTTKSVYTFRIGKEQEMIWVDKEEFNALIQGIAYSDLTTPIIVGSTSIVLVDTSDFTDSGSILIGENTYTYSANDRSTGTLTMSASTTTNDAGQTAFQQAGGAGLPTYYTVHSGYLWHWPMTSGVYDNRNYYLDYYKKQLQITKDSDEVVVPDASLLHYYLAAKFLIRQANGAITGDAQKMLDLYDARVLKLKQKETPNRKFIFKPTR